MAEVAAVAAPRDPVYRVGRLPSPFSPPAWELRRHLKKIANVLAFAGDLQQAMHAFASGI